VVNDQQVMNLVRYEEDEVELDIGKTLAENFLFLNKKEEKKERSI